jgi:hypothetical protein
MTYLHILDFATGVVLWLPWPEPMLPSVILYLGPETILPVASILASIIGFILMFWRVILKSVRNLFRGQSGATQASTTSPEESSEDAPPRELPGQ